MSHTPLPWELFNEGRGIVGALPERLIIARDLKEADAALIVSACNAYESNQALIRELAEQLKDVEFLLDEFPDAMLRVHDLLAKAKAVIGE